MPLDFGYLGRAPAPAILELDQQFVAGTRVAPWGASLRAYLLLQLAGAGPAGASSSASASGSDQGQGVRAGGGLQPCHARSLAALPSVEAEAAVLLARAVGGPAQGGGMPPVAVAALHVVLRTHTSPSPQAVPKLQEDDPGSGVGPLPGFPIVDVALDLGALPSLASLVVKVDSNTWQWGDLLPWPSVACKSALWRLRLSAALLPGGQLGALTRLEIGAQHASYHALLDGALVAELVCLVGERGKACRRAYMVVGWRASRVVRLQQANG